MREKGGGSRDIAGAHRATAAQCALDIFQCIIDTIERFLSTVSNRKILIGQLVEDLSDLSSPARASSCAPYLRKSDSRSFDASPRMRTTSYNARSRAVRGDISRSSSTLHEYIRLAHDITRTVLFRHWRFIASWTITFAMRASQLISLRVQNHRSSGAR